jgi:hypothetical protein
VFEEIELSFLPVGHTHEDIDQLFSRIAIRLQGHDAKTRQELYALVREAYTFRAKDGSGTVHSIPVRCYHLDKVANMSAWLERWMNPIHNQSATNLRHFRFTAHADGACISTKEWCDEPWYRFETPSGGFHLIKNDIPRPPFGAGIERPPHMSFKPIDSTLFHTMVTDLGKMSNADGRLSYDDFKALLADLVEWDARDPIPFHWDNDGAFLKEQHHAADSATSWPAASDALRHIMHHGADETRQREALNGLRMIDQDAARLMGPGEDILAERDQVATPSQSDQEDEGDVRDAAAASSSAAAASSSAAATGARFISAGNAPAFPPLRNSREHDNYVREKKKQKTAAQRAADGEALRIDNIIVFREQWGDDDEDAGLKERRPVWLGRVLKMTPCGSYLEIEYQHLTPENYSPKKPATWKDRYSADWVNARTCVPSTGIISHTDVVYFFKDFEVVRSSGAAADNHGSQRVSLAGFGRIPRVDMEAIEDLIASGFAEDKMRRPVWPPRGSANVDDEMHMNMDTETTAAVPYDGFDPDHDEEKAMEGFKRICQDVDGLMPRLNFHANQKKKQAQQARQAHKILQQASSLTATRNLDSGHMSSTAPEPMPQSRRGRRKAAASDSVSLRLA